MPTLDWLGKDKIVNHHLHVPFHFLDKKFSVGANSGNMIIHGDNLLALKSLLPRYAGKIKCIYIDPPYNTGNENWIYNDNVSAPQFQRWLGAVVGKEGEDFSRHDKWLCMMYPRLKLLQKLLADDGAIFISIDDNEQANLKLICDEIFGASNFVGTIHWRRSESQNNNSKLLANVAEYILCYLKIKTPASAFNKISLTNKASKEYRYRDDKGFFRRGTISDNSRGKNLIEVTSPAGKKSVIKSIRSKNFIEEQDRRGLIYWTANGMPYLKIYLDDSAGQVANNWFENAGVNEDARECLTKLGVSFEFSKPHEMIEKILKLATDKNSLVLDSFAGSGTTAHAVINLNKADGGSRRFILIELNDYAENITAERVKRVGGEFDYYELGASLFDAEGNLNAAAPIENLRDYIWYSETRKDLPPATDEKYLLGVDDNTAYYFYYEPEKSCVLNQKFLATIKTRANRYVIYADACENQLENRGIYFRQIPCDVRR